ncbi:hypothetical protein F4861DRAFT_147941 [Xylaria intraflava]|nr:hypothetical protein F4861DRAFT_147941 [Xylaria intraflava]
MSPDGTPFQHEIERLTQTSYAYTRPDLIGLHMFLRPPALSAPTPHQAEGPGTRSFALLHELKTGETTSLEPSSLANPPSEGATPVPGILFLRGFANAEWLIGIANKYGISPDLYGRHLEYVTSTVFSRNYFSSPALPSSSARVFQLRIPTIFVIDDDSVSYEPEDLRRARKDKSDIMSRYLQQLQSKANVGDSIVRECSLLSKQERVLEQTVTVEVILLRDSWRAVVWLDSGLDLLQSVKGVQKPWDTAVGLLPWKSLFLPVIVHPPAAGAQTQIPSPPGTTPAYAPSQPVTHPSSRRSGVSNGGSHAPQNACLLPFQYGTRLDRDLASRDALYALSELFQFAASAELQFLNFIHGRIEHELSFIGVERGPINHEVLLENLRYIRVILKPHEQSLAEVSALLENRSSLDWPRARQPDKSEKTASMLLTDFRYLLAHAKSLARECEQGMAMLANAAALEESRRTVDMGMRVERLTIIATIFIPLSFVCSVWGMNFVELGTGSQHVWWFFVTAGPIVLASFLIYRYDVVIKAILWILHVVRRVRGKRLGA